MQATAAFLFTNAVGQVVFTNRGFLRLTKRPQDRPPLAEALHTSLGVDEPPVRQFLQDLAHLGSVDRPALPLRTTTGTLRSMRAAGVAVYSGRESYIGADIQLAPPGLEVALLDAPRTHQDMLDNFARQALEEARSDRTLTLLQVYLTIQIDALQILLSRLGGLDMRATLERILNTTAVQLRIPIVMRGGYLEFGNRTVAFDAYRTFFQTATDYAVGAVGRRIVAEETNAINRRIDPGVLKTAALVGLTEAFDG